MAEVGPLQSRDGWRAAPARLAFVCACLGLLGAALLGSAAPAPAAKGKKAAKPNLRVTKLKAKGTAAPISPGASIGIIETIVNSGPQAAGKSVTRFYLTRDVKASLAERKRSKDHPRIALADLLLDGKRAVPKLKPKAKSTPRRPTKAKLPATTPSGEWFLLACADDTGAVKEAREHDNCRATGETIAVDGSNPAAEIKTYALSDVYDREPIPGEEGLIEAQRQTICPPDAKPRRLSYAAALKAIKRFLVKRAGKKAIAAFKRSPEHKKAKRAAAAAGAALLAAEPGAALAALARAHDLAPKEQPILVNMAAVATGVGLPNEALALLGEAATLELPKRTLTLNPTALAAIARAHALGASGRWGEAESAARAAEALEPFLTTEAANILSAAALCNNDRAAAVNFRRRSRVRQEPPPEPPIDESAGKASEVRNVPFPALPKNAASMAPFYRQLSEDLRSERFALIDQQMPLSDKTFGAGQRAEVVTRLRREGLWRRIWAVPDRYAKIDEALSALVRQAADVRREMWGNNHDGGRIEEISNEVAAACSGSPDLEQCWDEETRSRCRPAVRQYHQGWLNPITRAYAEAQLWYRSVSRSASGVAANFADPDNHTLALLTIAEHELDALGLIVQEAEYWTTMVEAAKENCVDDPEPATSEQPDDAPPVADPGRCPDAIARAKWSLTLLEGRTPTGSPWEIGAGGNCEEIEVEASIEPIPWLQAFGNINHSFKSADTTLVAGSRAVIKAGPLKGSFESALYIKQGPNVTESGLTDYDNPTRTDVGWRIGPSASVGPGAIAEYGGSGTMDLSFIGGFSDPR